jgi:hypothetical protein
LAALLHDFQVTGVSHVKRTEADDRFRESLLSLGVPRWRAYVMWAAVHLKTRLERPTVRIAMWVWLALMVTGMVIVCQALGSCVWLSIAGCESCPVGHGGCVGMCWHPSPLHVAAFLGPVISTPLWFSRTRSVRRLLCGLVAGLAAVYLVPMAVGNATAILLNLVLDFFLGPREPPYPWPKPP